MNCDEAFDALTDPAERDNSALKWHLEFCPRCREMQQVLAPALAMLAGEGESADRLIDEEDFLPRTGHRLPELFSDLEPPAADDPPRRFPAPFLTPEAVRLAEQTARSLHPARRLFAESWVRLIAAGTACLLALLTIVLTTAPSETASPSRSEAVMLADHCLWTERDTDNTAPPPEEASSRWVVLSCVSCHLEQSLE